MRTTYTLTLKQLLFCLNQEEAQKLSREEGSLLMKLVEDGIIREEK